MSPLFSTSAPNQVYYGRIGLPVRCVLIKDGAATAAQRAKWLAPGTSPLSVSKLALSPVISPDLLSLLTAPQTVIDIVMILGWGVLARPRNEEYFSVCLRGMGASFALLDHVLGQRTVEMSLTSAFPRHVTYGDVKSSTLLSSMSVERGEITTKKINSAGDHARRLQGKWTCPIVGEGVNFCVRMKEGKAFKPTSSQLMVNTNTLFVIVVAITHLVHIYLCLLSPH